MATDADAVVRKELAALLAVVEQWAGLGGEAPQAAGEPVATGPAVVPEPVARGTADDRGGALAPFTQPGGRAPPPAAAAEIGTKSTGVVHWRGRLPGRTSGPGRTDPAAGVGQVTRPAASAVVAPDTSEEMAAPPAAAASPGGVATPGGTASPGGAASPDVSAGARGTPAVAARPTAAPVAAVVAGSGGIGPAPRAPVSAGVAAPSAGVTPRGVSSAFERRHSSSPPAPGHLEALDASPGRGTTRTAPPTPSATHANPAFDAQLIRPDPEPTGFASGQVVYAADDLEERLADCIETALVEAGVDLS